jgi:hypothetical protein
MPPKVLLKNVGREIYDAFKKKEIELAESTKIILSNDEFLNLANMRLRFESNKEATLLINNSRIENSFFWVDKSSNLLLKARPDILHKNMIIDLKTTSDASPRAFQNEIIKYGYHIQFAMIRDAVEILEGNRIENFINIVIETKYPYNMAIYLMEQNAVDKGEIKYKQLCMDLKIALTTNEFKDYGIQTIGLPSWV